MKWRKKKNGEKNAVRASIYFAIQCSVFRMKCSAHLEWTTKYSVCMCIGNQIQRISNEMQRTLVIDKRMQCMYVYWE